MLQLDLRVKFRGFEFNLDNMWLQFCLLLFVDVQFCIATSVLKKQNGFEDC